MIVDKEIQALMHLVDDPDEEVYFAVSQKIISLGIGVLPSLQNVAQNSMDDVAKERAKVLIQKLHFEEICQQFSDWKNGNKNLIDGAILVSKYFDADTDSISITKEIEKIRRNIWLELNNYLTPLEEANIIGSILYNYFKLQGINFDYTNHTDFLISYTLNNKKGNSISNAIIYIALCQQLDIPVKALNIPKQFLLGYFDLGYNYFNTSTNHPSNKIKFYIDPLTGQMYSHKDIEGYFRRIAVPPTATYFKELSNTMVIQFLLVELSNCFKNSDEKNTMNDLLFLVQLLDE